MIIEDIEKEVLEWHRATFPRANGEAINKKFFEEVKELYASLRGEGNTIEELADVCIVGIVLLDRIGSSLSECISNKMAINKARTWGPEQPDGNRIKESK